MCIERDELQNKLEDIARSESILKTLGLITTLVIVVAFSFAATSNPTINNLGYAFAGIFSFLFVISSFEEEIKILSRMATYLGKCKRWFK